LGGPATNDREEWVMPLISGKVAEARGLTLASAVAAAICASPIAPAMAGDDGQAPIWTGLGGLIGLTHNDNDARIDYRERARLVLPPQMTLPPPAAPVAERTKAWPLDPVVAKSRKEKEDALNLLKAQSDVQALRRGDRPSPDQLRADRAAPGQPATANHCASQSNTRGCDWIPFRNVFESIGLAKPDEIVAGHEPDRDWLTDPPKGYRLPTATTVATQDNTPKPVDPRDSKALLYQPPEQP
jgi:hypothetical protein